MLAEHWFKGYPGVGLLTNKIGVVPAHPANAQRLLHDERRLALVFPEGQKGTRKLYWQRYKLRRFGRGGFVRTAMRARVPIVPIAVVGAEDAMPIFAHLPLMQRLTGLIYFPVNHAFPHFGAAAALMYLPAEVPDPLPRADRPLPLRARGRRGSGARPGGGRGRPRQDPGGARFARGVAHVRLVRLGSGPEDEGVRQDARVAGIASRGCRGSSRGLRRRRLREQAAPRRSRSISRA